LFESVTYYVIIGGYLMWKKATTWCERDWPQWQHWLD